MSAVAALAYAHISEEPRVMSGQPCIAGTRVRVMDVVAATKSGISPEGLKDYFSSRPLTLSEIYGALSFYYDHQEQIEAALAEDSNLGVPAEGDPTPSSR